MSIHFSSATDEWPTPQKFFDACDAEFGPFTLDPCCTAQSAKASKFFTKEDDGLAQEWGQHTVWMNPPYGRTIGHWMRKAYSASQYGAKVVCLVPARTDTAWWHDYAMKGSVRFIRGRLKFGDAKNAAPFPNALVVFEPMKGWDSL